MGLFIVGYLGLAAILLFGAARLVKDPLTVWTARATAWILRLLGAHGEAMGTLVTSTLFTVDIIPECTALFPIVIFSAAILVSPSSWPGKLLGVVLGVVVLLLINQVRLVSLFYIGRYRPGAFEMAHLLVWQSLMIFFTAALWLVWASLAIGRRESRSA